MKMDLSRLRDENVSSIVLNGQVEKDQVDIDGRRIRFIEPIKYEGEIYKVDDDYLIHIDVIYKYEEICGRCLEPFIKEERTFLSGKLVKKSDETMEDEEGEIIYYSDEKLDLTEEIMTMVYLSLPMKPLCKVECKGICPQCGANLNVEECNCIVEDIDPRFAVLKDLWLNE
jgi:uncharacterized protein